MAYEKDQHPTAKLARIISLSLMAITTLIVVTIYGVMFNSMSEDLLVQVSFLWVTAMAFGAGGLLLAHKGIGPSFGIAAVIALGAFLALQTFYVTIWPSL